MENGAPPRKQKGEKDVEVTMRAETKKAARSAALTAFLCLRFTGSFKRKDRVISPKKRLILITFRMLNIVTSSLMHTVVLANLAYFSLDRICASIPVLKRAESAVIAFSRPATSKENASIWSSKVFASVQSRRSLSSKRDANGLPRR